MTEGADVAEASKTNGSTELTMGEEVRALHRRYPTGVTVVTVCEEDGTPRGLAVNAMTSVSLEPPLMLVAVNATSSTFPALFAADHLVVNVLSTSQADVVKAFARSGGDKFQGVDWFSGETGSPVLAGSTGYFELAVKYKIPAYTHTIFIGEVVAARHTDDPAMIYLGGNFYDSADLPAVV